MIIQKWLHQHRKRLALVGALALAVITVAGCGNSNHSQSQSSQSSKPLTSAQKAERIVAGKTFELKDQGKVMEALQKSANYKINYDHVDSWRYVLITKVAGSKDGKTATVTYTDFRGQRSADNTNSPVDNQSQAATNVKADQVLKNVKITPVDNGDEFRLKTANADLGPWINKLIIGKAGSEYSTFSYQQSRSMYWVGLENELPVSANGDIKYLTYNVVK